MSNFLFTIGDIAKLAGITPKTIRHYHQIDLLAEPVRDVNNYRMYSIDQLEQIQLILRLKKLGLSLKQIKLILKSDEPDELIRIILQQHQRRIRDEITALQDQQDDIQAYLDSDITLSDHHAQEEPAHSAMVVLSDAIKPHSNGLSDVLIVFEGDVLEQIDRYQWDTGYDHFWHQIGQQVAINLKQNERLLIFWLERYIALGEMETDDLQGQAWLQDLSHSPDRSELKTALNPPTLPFFSEKDQQQIRKLIPSLLYQNGSTLQQQFLRALLTPRSIEDSHT